MYSSSSPSGPPCSLWLFSVSSVLNSEKRDEDVRALQTFRRQVQQKILPAARAGAPENLILFWRDGLVLQDEG
jgi:hypothetical protein